MKFINTVAFTRPSNIINEDNCAASCNLLIAMDGATGLYKANYTPEASDARWLSQRGVELIQEMLAEDNAKGDDLPEIIAEASKRIGAEFADFAKEKLARGESVNPEAYPSSGLSIAWLTDGKIYTYSLGDLPIAVFRKDGTCQVIRTESLPAMDKIVIDKMARLAKEKGEDVIDQRPLVNDDLRINRNLRNTEEGYYIFEPGNDAVGKGLYQSFEAKDVARVLIVSDGIADAVGMYGIFPDYIAFADSVAKDGGEEAYRLLREVQAADPGCNRFPRFKLGDDVSIVYGEIEE